MTLNLLTSVGKIVGNSFGHLFAALLVAGIAAICWTALYFALFVSALLFGKDVGGLLAYPAGLIFVILVELLRALFLLMPATISARWWGRRYHQPIIPQLVAAVVILSGLSLAATLFFLGMGKLESLSTASICLGVLFVTQLIPLGFYWWETQAVSAGISLLESCA